MVKYKSRVTSQVRPIVEVIPETEEEHKQLLKDSKNINIRNITKIIKLKAKDALHHAGYGTSPLHIKKAIHQDNLYYHAKAYKYAHKIKKALAFLDSKEIISSFISNPNLLIAFIEQQILNGYRLGKSDMGGSILTEKNERYFSAGFKSHTGPCQFTETKKQKSKRNELIREKAIEYLNKGRNPLNAARLIRDKDLRPIISNIISIPLNELTDEDIKPLNLKIDSIAKIIYAIKFPKKEASS